MSKKILIIEDNEELARLLQLHLQDLSYAVMLALDGKTGLLKAESEPCDLIILDLMLPDIDGLEVVRRVRSRPNYTPILILTAKSSEPDRVVGLEMGADDYVTKPFSIRELLARVKAIFRRIEVLRAEDSDHAAQILQRGDMVIDVEKRKVSIQDSPVELTAKEFDLLCHFAKNPDKVYTRAQLLDQVWGYGHEGYEHTVNSHINRLRAKIEENPAKPRYILTVWGVGYRFVSQGKN